MVLHGACHRGLVTLALVALGVVSLVAMIVVLRVNVEPNVPFELRLDGKVVGTESPVVVPSVSIGEHRLSVMPKVTSLRNIPLRWSKAGEPGELSAGSG